MAKEDISEIVLTPIDEIFPYPHNNKQHPENQVVRIARSISMYGFDSPIVVDEEGVILKGHGRHLASLKLGLEKVPVVIQRNLTDEEKMLTRIADNKVAESEWDTKVLWEDMTDESMNGFDLSDFGFRKQTAKRLFFDQDLSLFGIEKTNREKEYEKYRKDKAEEKEGDEVDSTATQIESFVTSFRKENRFYRHMPMIDYLHTHDKILVGTSGGKDSLAGLIWCLENLDRDKIVPYFGNLGYGLDWSCTVTYIKLIEKMYDIKIICAGDTSPYMEGGFYEKLLQYGYPHPLSCWVRNQIKIRNTKSVQMQFKSAGDNICVVLSVRWSESENRRKTYPDRGILKDGSFHFASPIIQWTDTDVCRFLWERGLRLPPPYQHETRSGCLICPNEGRKTLISIRKKYPLFWEKILEWHARGARRTKGELALHHVKKVLSSIDDLTPDEVANFSSLYSPIALNPKEFEDYLEEQLGEKLPCENYTRITYDPKYHNFPNDIDPEIQRRASLSGALGDPECTSVFG